MKIFWSWQSDTPGKRWPCCVGSPPPSRPRAANILRCKGILSIAGELEQFVFQGVHMVLDRAVGRPWPPGGQRTSKLVFIGRELDAGELRHGLNGCVVGAA